MLFAIHKGNVPTYQDGQDKVVYLVTTTEVLANVDLDFVFTDRNAALALAEYADDLNDLDRLVDWDLMNAVMWKNTDDEPDRRERRMAEMLVHQSVPWDAIIAVVGRTNDRVGQIGAILANVGGKATPVQAKPGWYF